MASDITLPSETTDTGTSVLSYFATPHPTPLRRMTIPLPMEDRADFTFNDLSTNTHSSRPFSVDNIPSPAIQPNKSAPQETPSSRATLGGSEIQSKLHRQLVDMQEQIRRVALASGDHVRSLAPALNQHPEYPAAHQEPSPERRQHHQPHATSTEIILDDLREQMKEYLSTVDEFKKSLYSDVEQRLMEWERGVFESLIQPHITSSMRLLEQKHQATVSEMCAEYLAKELPSLLETRLQRIIQSVSEALIPMLISACISPITTQVLKTIEQSRQQIDRQDSRCMSESLSKPSLDLHADSIPESTPTRTHLPSQSLHVQTQTSMIVDVDPDSKPPIEKDSHVQVVQQIHERLLEKINHLNLIQQEILQSAECSNRFSLEQASVQQKHSCRHRVDYHPTPSPHVVDELSQYPLHEDDGFRHTHPAQTNSRRVPSPSLLEAARRFEAYTSVFRHSGGYMDHKITDGHMMRPRHSPPVVVPPQQKIVLPDTQILVPYVRNLAALDTHLSESDRFVQMMKAVHQQFPVLRDPLYFSALRILLKDAVAGRLLFGNLDQAN